MEEKLFPDREPFGPEICVKTSREFILSRRPLCRSSMEDINKGRAQEILDKRKQTDRSILVLKHQQHSVSILPPLVPLPIDASYQ